MGMANNQKATGYFILNAAIWIFLAFIFQLIDAHLFQHKVIPAWHDNTYVTVM